MELPNIPLTFNLSFIGDLGGSFDWWREFDCDFCSLICCGFLNELLPVGVDSADLDGCGWWEELD